MFHSCYLKSNLIAQKKNNPFEVNKCLRTLGHLKSMLHSYIKNLEKSKIVSLGRAVDLVILKLAGSKSKGYARLSSIV